uniref:Transmembrane protein n=1 Tax=Entomoneis paludosa TaxID=265537 RepID=A0A6U3ERK7_9STRA|mmetsp:Transcript_8165/g.17039  ORF Transcript_8165/g.17039 Transcript_8165/m.17039 type:complete len:284 (+) Transcript_8165:78-929(+)
MGVNTTNQSQRSAVLVASCLILACWSVESFQVQQRHPLILLTSRSHAQIQRQPTTLFVAESKNAKIDLSSASEVVPITDAKADTEETDENVEQDEGAAVTGTVNERLMAELQEAADKEKFGARSSMGKKLGLDAFKSSKTDEERRVAIEEARNLNGVNPLVTLLGSIFALGVAYGLWTATTLLGVWFAQHPADTDVYFVQRSTAVFRNIVMGLVSLASGFFGVTGLGILLLTFRVATGVAKGELDPTPIVQNSGPLKEDDFEIGNAWDLMMNKKPSRRRGGKN